MDAGFGNNAVFVSGKVIADRRRLYRSALDPLVTVTLQAAQNDCEFLCTLTNISPLGVMAELLCGEGFGPLAPGDELHVACCDQGLEDLMEQRLLRVVWQQDERAGFAFEAALPVANEELQQRLEDQRLLPWSGWLP